MKKDLKVFVFFGSDIKCNAPEFLQEKYRSGHTLLPLDAKAMLLAAKAGAPYTLVDDWIDKDSREEAHLEGIECSHQWFNATRSEFTTDGICWPELDHQAMYYFWLHVSVLDKMVRSFREREITELSFFHNNSSPDYQLYYYRSNVHSTYWSIEFPNITKPISGNPQKAKNILFRYTQSGLKKILKIKVPSKSINETKDISDKIIFAINSGEVFRFKTLVQKLNKSFPGQIGIVAISGDQTTALKVSETMLVPVMCLPSSHSVNEVFSDRFLRAYQSSCQKANRKPWEKSMRMLPSHFEYFCKNRWPYLSALFNDWITAWNKLNPTVVIVSALEDAESQLPAAAAKRLGIPSVAIPHGEIMAKTSKILASDCILCGSLLQKKNFKLFGISSNNLAGCRDVIMENEYLSLPPHDTQKQYTQKWNVLALTDPVNFSKVLLPGSSYSAQLTALRTLNSPPQDLFEGFELKIKTHPGYPDRELFSIVNDQMLKNVLPPKSDLHVALDKSSLIIAVNYSGSALIHALRLRKPLILFYTNPLLGNNNRLRFSTSELFLEAGLLVRTGNDLWHAIKDFFTNGESARKLQTMADEFFKNNLDNRNFPSIGEILHQIISAHKNSSQTKA